MVEPAGPESADSEPADPEPLDITRREALSALPHGFFGRSGGGSRGDIAGLNVGYGAQDDPQVVARNRQMAAEAIGGTGATLFTPHQVHSADAVILANQPWNDDSRPVADAVVSASRGAVIGVVTADCAPVLLADREAGVIAAAHAGWRGAHGGIIAATIAAMEELGAQPFRIAAAIGPCIAQASYEVDDGFRARFAKGDAVFFKPGRAGHQWFDLEGYVAACLARCGIGSIDALGLDTYCNADRFFSYRRSVHRGEPTYGRQLSTIALP